MRIVILLTFILIMTLQPAAFADEDQKAQGKAVYEHWCTPCHGPSLRKPGTAALKVKYNDAIPAVLEDRTDMTTEYVSLIVREGLSIMPFFRHTEISDPDLEAMALYLTDKDE